ncbi:MAG: TIGR03936 family radical SAM-associated protein, partial [Treponema sp.]|nr:TIGR03936 family radical SAM-associated protein [Treponema sp.]
PAPDFERLLREKRLPLYGLDTGISLGDTHVLMFTLGYELGITEVLAMLDVSSIPIHAAQRREEDPVVIIGGCCVSNPLPYSAFADAFWIGEAEAGFFDLAMELLEMKKRGEGRGPLLEKTAGHPSVWVKGKKKAVRAIDAGFALRPPCPAVFPVAGMKVVQQHGAVEIMRGCPNGCRFCHAGFWYRPMRQKRLDVITKEAEAFIEEGGYREISLYSLSSGDYRHIDALVSSLERRFSARHVSFQLPSLKISTFSLSLLEKISRVRKSGLTFAVETPLDAWQLAANKQASLEDTCAILAEAKKSGWRGAKFYFMVGLPHSAESEAEAIVDFIIETGRRTGTRCTVSLGIFVPKPHTPYQWASQIDGGEALRRCEYIRLRLKPLGHKVNMPDPLASVIEGILSRGDEKACGIVEEAFNLGCRFDAWSEYLHRDVWTDISSRFSSSIQSWLDPAPGKEPAWNCIDPQTGTGYLKGEYSNSMTGQLTSTCMINCTHPCGSCLNDTKIVENNIHQDTFPSAPDEDAEDEPLKKGDPNTCRLLFSYEKKGTAVFHSHLDMVEIFSMALIRAGIPVVFTAGFNPIQKIEFVSPLSVGIEAFNEIAAIDTEFPYPAPDFAVKMNAALPQGIRINAAENYLIRSGLKKYSLSSLFWGSGYVKKGRAAPADLVRMKDEKEYRKSAAEQGFSNFDLIRTAVFAGAATDGADVPGADTAAAASYFDAYGALYPAARPGKLLTNPLPAT